MSSVWTKARKNTPEIDCGLCGFTTCAAFARAVVVGGAEVSVCPILGLTQYDSQRSELLALSGIGENTEKPAPELPEGGVLLSQPCTDSPNLLMAEMRIFNGVDPGQPMRFGVLDPSILCWFLDCVSSRYEDMRCSKELAYAWGDMEETKVHILRDGRVRMRRARGSDHALESFKIIERTVMGSVICNCCGRDLLTVLAGLVTAKSEFHTVLKAGSTFSIKRELAEWTPERNKKDVGAITEMVDIIDELYSEMMNHLDLLISGNVPAEYTLETRSKICKIISLMVNTMIENKETVFLKGLSVAFFIDNAVLGLISLHNMVTNGLAEMTYIVKLLNSAKDMTLHELDVDFLSASEVLPLAHSARVERAIKIYNKWKRI